MANSFLGRCKYCYQTKVLIKNTHIIPRCFQKFVKDDDNKMTMITAGKNNGKEVYNAFWDSGLLCADCDNSFSSDENYTYQFFKQFRDQAIEPVNVVKDPHGITFQYDIDTKRIKRCLLSILWRMAISKRSEFKNVDLGKIAVLLRDGLYNNTFMKDTFFPVSILSSRNVNNLKAKVLSPPTLKVKFQHRFNYVYIYTLYLPDIVILFYASQQMKVNVQNIGIKEHVLLEVNQENGELMNELLSGTFKNLNDVPRF